MEKHLFLSTLPFDQFNEQDKLIRGVEAFRAGTWRGFTYTRDHLNQMAENFKKLREEGLLEPPLKVDHSESARDVIGWVKNLYVEGDSLMADVLVTEDEAIQKIKRGTWKKVSSEIYHNYIEEANGKEYGMVFRALSIVSIPHLKNIKGIVLNAEEVSEMHLEELKKLIEQKFSEISKDKADFGELTNKLMDEFKAFYAEEVQKYKEEAEKAKADAQKFAEMLKAKEIEQEIRGYAEAGKIVPAQEEVLGKLLKSFNEEQAKLFKEFMEKGAKVDLEKEHGEFHEEKSLEEMSPEEAWKKYLG